MINRQSITALKSAAFRNHFMRPLYDSYCFSRIPGTIEYLLTGSSPRHLPLDVVAGKTGANKVLLLFIDSFGWIFFEKYKHRYPFLERFLKKGTVSKLTSQFPSTTAAHVTAIHTGLETGESGIYEWTYWEPKIKKVINPLLFSVADGSKGKGTLNALGVQPRDIFPTRTLYQHLKTQGVTSHIFQYNGYTPSEYSDVVFDGAIVHPYPSFIRGLVELGNTIRAQGKKQYFFYYYDAIDSAGHAGGPGSQVHEAEIHNTFTMLEDILYRLVARVPGLTILLTADHGVARVDPTTCVYLDQLPSYAKRLEPYLEKDQNGTVIAPIGSPRDMFLKVPHQQVNKVIAYLQKELEGKADVVATDELIHQGFFGNASKEFTEKVGSIVTLPYNGESVWWYGSGGMFRLVYKGHHGGLSPEEMQIPFLYL